MDRLLDYAHHHPALIAYALLTGLALLAYETWQRANNAGGISPQDLIRLMNQGAAILDLREAEAFAQGHINGARHIVPTELDSAADTLKRFKDKTVVVYDDRGGNAAALRTLTGKGFTKVFSLRGGLTAWRAENLPLARD